MANQDSSTQVSSLRLILVPGLITLAVTILRLVGELQHWSRLLFNPSAGGGGALVGIAWLAPIFGIYFALKLTGAGARPASLGRATVFTMVGFLVMGGGGALMGLSLGRSYALLAGGMVLLAAAAVIPLAGWPALTKTLIAYGYAARIPVAIVMFFAMQGQWGTHYDAPPPNLPEMSFWPKYVLIGLLPQLIFWVTFTVITGSLFGIIATALFRRQQAPTQATS